MKKRNVRKASLLFFFIFLLLVSPADAQTDSLIAKWADLSEDDDAFIEQINELYENPVNINRAGRSAIAAIPFITPAQADSIIELRKKIGKFTSKSQLRRVLGREVYLLVKDIVTLHSEKKHAVVIAHRNYYPIEKLPAIESGKYAGNALYDHNKLYYRYGNRFRFGAVTQKDIGEKKYTDFYTGFGEYTGNNYKFILGNYYLQFGQGLIFSSAFGSRKSALSTLPFKTNRNGGFASLSSSENTGHFGAYTTLQNFYTLEFHGFYARNIRDARISGSAITGLDYDGYHRTVSEINKQDLIEENLYGFSALINPLENISAGLIVAQTRYTPSLQSSAETLGEKAFRRQYFNFSGNRLTQYGLFYTFHEYSLRLKGELALSDQGGPGINQSLFVDLENIEFGINYWRLSKNYQAPFGRIFDDANPFPRAEEGFYAALALKPFKRVKLYAYKVFHRDTWRSYFNPLPASKNEWLIELNYKLKGIALSGRVRQKEKDTFVRPENGRELRRTAKQNIFRLQADFRPLKQIKLRLRWEHTLLNPENESGTLFFQDMVCQLPYKLQLSTRLNFFRTDSYASRIYEYERDLPGSFANYALYGEGRSWYVMIKWFTLNRISLWLKLRYLYVTDTDLTNRIMESMINRTLRFQLQVNI